MKRVVPLLTVVLIAAWCVVVVLSWLLSAMMVSGVRSVLTGEGIRWFFAHFTDALSTPVLAWMLIAAIAFGCLRGSRLLSADGGYRRKRALRVALLLLAFYATGVALLIVPPHAVLLSATGTLADSPFSRALVPLLCFGVVLLSVAYGLLARTFSSFSAIVETMAGGIRTVAPLLFLYVLAAQLVHTLAYVFL